MTGFEPLIGPAAAGLGGLITNLVKDKGTETLKKLDWDIGRNLALRKALNEYVSRYVKRHGSIKFNFLRMEKVSLDDVYTAVQVFDWSALPYCDSQNALQQQYQKSDNRSFNVIHAEGKSGLQVANEQQYLMVLGEPGVGKSTFLWKVGVEALKSLHRQNSLSTGLKSKLRISALQGSANKDSDKLRLPQDLVYQHFCIPVLLELQQLNKSDRSIKAVIAKELEICGFPEAEMLTELFLKNGKLLLLLDGLDEVSSITLSHTITEIKDLVDTYSRNRFIVSCRSAAYSFGGFTHFKDVAIFPFKDKQIQQFIQNWFQKDCNTEINTAERCWQLLNRPNYQAVKELARTPLLLTLLCVVYGKSEDFPKERNALYAKALDILLRKWTAEKRIQRNPIYPELSTELELKMLAEIAYTSFVDDQLFFPKDRLIHQIRDFLVDNLNAPRHLDSEAVLKEIEIQQGILVEWSDAYSFSHLTFHEYLTAKCIVDRDKITQLVRNHLTEWHWQEVFFLVSGLLSGKRGADDLLLAMERQAQTYLASDKLTALLNWANQTTKQSLGYLNLPAKRTAAILLALNHIDELNIADTLARIHSGDVDKAHNSNHRYSLEYSHDLTHLSNLAIIDNFLTCKRIYFLIYCLDHNCKHYLNIDETNTSSLDETDPITYRLIRILNILRKYQEAEVFNPGLLNSLVNKIDCAVQKLVSGSPTRTERLTIAVEIYSSFARDLDFKKYDILITQKELNLLSSYFYALELMVFCKEAAVRVSPQVWAGIEERMVTVPKE